MVEEDQSVRDRNLVESGASGVFDGMVEYCTDRERMPPLVFAGRENVLEGLISSSIKVGRNPNASGMTHIVEGIPGAGKTSIIREFNNLHQGAEIEVPRESARTGKEVVDKKRLFIIEMPAAELDTPPLQLVRAIRSEWERYCLSAQAGGIQAARKHTGKTADLARITLKLDAETEVVAKMNGLSDKSGLGACLDAYLGDDIVVALCLDEAHNCPSTKNAAKIAEALHLATHGASCVAFYFGVLGTSAHIGNSREAGGLGLSRMNAECRHRIGLFEPGEARQVAQGTFDALGLTWEGENGWREYAKECGFTEDTWGSFRQRLEEAVVAGASDFPQHVTLGLQSACHILHGRKSTLKAGQKDEILQELRAEHERKKKIYYEERLQGLEAYAAAFGAICRKSRLSISGSVAEYEAQKAISVGVATKKDPLPDAEAEKILENALRKGVLSRAEDMEIAPPEIPSMSSYLDERLESAISKGKPYAVRAAEALSLDVSGSDPSLAAKGSAPEARKKNAGVPSF